MQARVKSQHIGPVTHVHDAGHPPAGEVEHHQLGVALACDEDPPPLGHVTLSPGFAGYSPDSPPHEAGFAETPVAGESLSPGAPRADDRVQRIVLVGHVDPAFGRSSYPEL